MCGGLRNKMDNKKIMVWVIIGLFALGGLGMISFSNKGHTTQKNTNQQQSGSYNDMVARMHPNQQAKQIPITGNSNMNKIKFSDAVGKPAPDFTLTTQKNSRFTLSDYKNKTVVLFFNEGAMCYPSCWNQIASLSADKRFNNDNVVTASIVIDKKEKWDRIISSQPKYGAGIILFDTNRAVSQAYDMLNVPSSMHKGSFPGHTYIIIKKGIISYILDDPNMALNNDVLASKL